ncbi:hypothetical protein BC629DRAFT_1302069, partial [Irpex lacteus]
MPQDVSGPLAPSPTTGTRPSYTRIAQRSSSTDTRERHLPSSASAADPVHITPPAVPETSFPPSPLPLRDVARMVRDWREAISAASLAEAVCHVCGCLTPCRDLHQLASDSPLLHVLNVPGVTRRARATPVEPSCSIGGPVLYHSLPGNNGISGSSSISVCSTCMLSLGKNSVPILALANGRWLGEVPTVLSELNFMEKILVARYHHNCSIIRVHKGPCKMRANCIVFAQPVAKLLSVLPMPRDELQAIFAVLFTGSIAPTPDDFKRTPFLVRRSFVWRALLWLKTNNFEYADVQLSQANLNSYDDMSMPVSFFHQPSDNADPVESLSVHERTAESGTSSGTCSLSVHGVTEEDLVTM